MSRELEPGVVSGTWFMVAPFPVHGADLTSWCAVFCTCGHPCFFKPGHIKWSLWFVATAFCVDSVVLSLKLYVDFPNDRRAILSLVFFNSPLCFMMCLFYKTLLSPTFVKSLCPPWYPNSLMCHHSYRSPLTYYHIKLYWFSIDLKCYIL